MLNIRFRGLPYALVQPASLPVAVNTGIMPSSLPYAGQKIGVPDFPVHGLWWSPQPVVWAPIRP